jgi:hypothetical protein
MALGQSHGLSQFLKGNELTGIHPPPPPLRAPNNTRTALPGVQLSSMAQGQRSKDRCPRASNLEPRAENQEPRTKNREPRNKKQETRNKKQEQRPSHLGPLVL